MGSCRHIRHLRISACSIFESSPHQPLLRVENAPFTEWSIQIRQSNKAAYTALFQATQVPLLRYAWRLTQDEQAACDVVQDAFLKLWRIRERLDSSKSLKSLLYTMVRNLALNHNRSASRDGGDLDEIDPAYLSSAPRADAEVAEADLSAFLHDCIDELPPRRREAFMLSRFEGLTHDEIAQLMGLTPRTVNTHIVLALKTLRQRLSGYEPSLMAL